MHTPPSPRHRYGLTLPETLIAIAVAAILVATALTTVSQSRRHAQVSASLANLHVFASGTAFYANDNAERVWTFSWQPGPTPSAYADLGTATSFTDAHAKQFTDILRRRTGRDDLPHIDLVVPHLNYSHLVLADYLAQRLPADFAVSPGDRNRRLWANDPDGIADLPADVRPPTGPTLSRWPYSSSYQLPPAFFSSDWGAGEITIAQGSRHDAYVAPNSSQLGNRRLTEVAFPAHKVMLHEYADFYHADRPIYFAYREARVPILFADGSAAVRATLNANPGFRPNFPMLPVSTTLTYVPAAWEPPTLSGAASQHLLGFYRWTAGGLRGRDFDATQILPSP